MIPAVALIAALDAASFSYNASAPLETSVVRTSTAAGLRDSLLTFVSGNRVVRAELIEPARAHSRGPGILFVHWLGDDATTNHREFEPDARALAARGGTCLLVDAMWSTELSNGKDWFTQIRSTQTDYAASIAQVVDLRRALDLLLAQPGVDPARVAYVGHDFGAMYGALLAGVDSRPRYFVLMAGTTSFSRWYLLGAKPVDVAAYEEQMAPLDPLPYLRRSTASGFMFQFAAHDKYVTGTEAMDFFAAAPLPRGVFMYDAQHDLKVPLAMADRLAWLRERLFG